MNENGERNGNAKLMSIVAGAVLTTALGTWAATGKNAQSLAQEAKDRATTLEVRVDGVQQLTEFRLKAIEQAQKEQSETLKNMWRLMEEQRRERGR